jgi:hypothetical protein
MLVMKIKMQVSAKTNADPANEESVKEGLGKVFHLWC